MSFSPDGRTLVALSDIRTGLPGSADERLHGDGAAAFVVGDGPDVAAEIIGFGAASAEFLDRWRLPGAAADRVWEERFAEGPYTELGEAAWASALAVVKSDFMLGLVIVPRDSAIFAIWCAFSATLRGTAVASFSAASIMM